jgi:hypothetical protein
MFGWLSLGTARRRRLARRWLGLLPEAGLERLHQIDNLRLGGLCWRETHRFAFHLSADDVLKPLAELIFVFLRLERLRGKLTYELLGQLQLRFFDFGLPDRDLRERTHFVGVAKLLQDQGVLVGAHHHQ